MEEYHQIHVKTLAVGHQFSKLRIHTLCARKIIPFKSNRKELDFNYNEKTGKNVSQHLKDEFQFH